MTEPTPEAEADNLIAVADVDGAEPAVREEVSRTGVGVGAATAALRKALNELHKSDDEAWRRYAFDLEEASRRFDTTMGLAAARLRAERASSEHDLKEALDDVALSWRSRAEEIRVQAHIGSMDVRDRGEETISELERASQRVVTLLSRIRDEVTDSLTVMRDEARAALDDAAPVRALHAPHDVTPGGQVCGRGDATAKAVRSLVLPQITSVTGDVVGLRPRHGRRADAHALHDGVARRVGRVVELRLVRLRNRCDGIRLDDASALLDQQRCRTTLEVEDTRDALQFARKLGLVRALQERFGPDVHWRSISGLKVLAETIGSRRQVLHGSSARADPCGADATAIPVHLVARLNFQGAMLTRGPRPSLFHDLAPGSRRVWRPMEVLRYRLQNASTAFSRRRFSVMT